MFALQKLSSSVIKPYVQLRNCTYNNKIKDPEFRHLFLTLDSHIESNLTNIIPTVSKIFYRTWEPHPYEPIEREVREIISQSVSESMKKITHRPMGAKSGVMYEEEYYKLILEKKDGYLEHDFYARRGVLKREYPCFTTGKSFNYLVKKNDVLGSEAIHSFFEGPTSADCGSTIEAVFYKAILDVLGDEKFNKIWKDPKNQLIIGPYVSCFGKTSRLSSFLEYMDPKISQETDEKKLLIGDHVMVTGSPWYSLKHPTGNMSNTHGVIVGFNKKNRALIQALGLTNGYSMTIDATKKMLIECSNQYQSKVCLEYIKKFHRQYPSKKVLANHFKDYPYFKSFDPSYIFKESTVKEAAKFGGCILTNSDVTRLSSYVLAVLKKAPLDANLNEYLHLAKAEVLVRQMFKDRNEYLDFLNKLKSGTIE